jgi:hypothetical protein
VALTPQTTIKVSMFSTRTASATHGDAGAAKLVAHSSPMNTQLGTDLPSKFFADCYELRRRLVHGTTPLPERREVDVSAAQLERFVAHLLSHELLDTVPD